MIKLELNAGYCHDCPNFEADVEKPPVCYSGLQEIVFDNTYIRCAHRKVCANITNHIETAIRKEYEDHA